MSGQEHETIFHVQRERIEWSMRDMLLRGEGLKMKVL